MATTCVPSLTLHLMLFLSFLFTVKFLSVLWILSLKLRNILKVFLDANPSDICGSKLSKVVLILILIVVMLLLLLLMLLLLSFLKGMN